MDVLECSKGELFASDGVADAKWNKCKGFSSQCHNRLFFTGSLLKGNGGTRWHLTNSGLSDTINSTLGDTQYRSPMWLYYLLFTFNATLRENVGKILHFPPYKLIYDRH